MDRLAVMYAASPLLFWVIGSLAAYTLTTNLLWFTRSRGFWRSSYSRWLGQIGRFLFYVGVPYLALGGWPRLPFQGDLSAADMGLVGLNADWPPTRWLGAVGLGLGLGLAAFLILALAWRGANRAVGSARLHFPPRPWWVVGVDILYLQVHWAFYRGALAVARDDLYAGVFWGLGLVYLEWAFNPFWRQDWRLEARAAERWLRVALALVTALTFLLGRNLWVCLVLHLLIETVFRQLGSARTAAQS